MLRRIRALSGDAQGRLRCTLAWSGGLDSTVLLHLLVAARRQLPGQLTLRAIHVDHGLQPAAVDFIRFCRHASRRWRVPLTVVKATVHRTKGASPEEAAREARYAALSAALRPGELLLTAQHADDQLETLLLALMRGAGPAGLAAMPQSAPIGVNLLLRPLLDVERAQLAAYATAESVEYCVDPTNDQQQYDRNFLRARVVPVLRERWPAVARTAVRSASHCAVADAALEQAARSDLQAAADGPDLEIAVLRRWSAARRAAVLRLWLAGQGVRPPGQRHIAQLTTMMDSRADASPALHLPGFAVRRHAGRLLLDLSAAAPAREWLPQFWTWTQGPLQLEGRELAVQADQHGDLDLAQLPEPLLVQYPGVAGGRTLRKQMQQLAVPEWQRAQLPLVFAAGKKAAPGRLLAIADLWLAEVLRSSDASVRRGRIFWRELR